MPERLITLPAGSVLAVTDLHGAWDVYVRLRDKFLTLREAGAVQTLLLCGDLIHAEENAVYDASLDIILDVLRLRRDYGRDTVIMLLGNHEMPHIYSLTLSRGDTVYTPPFEAALTGLAHKQRRDFTRDDVIEFFAEAPFYAATRAGVLFAHAGASPELTDPADFQRVLSIDHDALLQAADEQIQNFGAAEARANFERILKQPYDEQVRQLLAVSGPDDPRYNHLVRSMVVSNSNPLFDLLWSALFTRNEHEVGVEAYPAVVADFLRAVSVFAPVEQRVLVSGHIPVLDGYEMIGTQQLRLASYTHARPQKAGRYLVLDTEQPVMKADDLVPLLRYTAEA